MAADAACAQSEAYLNLLIGCLSRTVIPEYYEPFRGPANSIYRGLYSCIPVRRLLQIKGLELVRRYKMDPNKRSMGKDWPPDAETMIGLKRLDNLRQCVQIVIQDDIPGDFIETGVWRGGACILMRGALSAFGDDSRCVWVADSFEGLPKPNAEKYAFDRGDCHWTRNDYLAISLEEVQANFARYHLLDDRVKFLKGWFRDTLPSAPIEKLAILRLDGDMYESTMDALSALYHKLSLGGFVIVDDYLLNGCRAAINDYRAAYGISDPIVDIDGSAIYWRRRTQ
jgi:O-methyltransferase